MLFWIIISIATALTALLLLSPLLRRQVSAAGEHSHDVEVYRDQLKEVERDEAQGLISAEEAGYAKAEIGRRLIASAEKAKQEGDAAPAKRNILAQAFIIVAVPALCLGLYILTGSPGLPSQPLQARLDNPGDDIGILIAKTENHLAANPGDGSGWELLAPIYLRNGRPDEAANAFRRAIGILGATPERLGGLGEALVALNNGIITEEAKSSFEAVLKIDPKDPRAQYYVASALEQEGRSLEALAAFRTLAETSPPDAPWQPVVAQHIEMLQKGPAPPVAQNPNAPGNPSAADIAAAQDMSEADRQQMILGMVEGLDEKLKSDPKNFEGWVRLVRSYAMLKQPEKAGDALARALVVFPANTDEGKQISALAAELGLKNAEANQ